MSTLTDFLLARIAEDEADAKAATPGPWRWEEPSGDDFPTGDQDLVSDGKTYVGEVSGEVLPTTVLHGWGYDASGIHAEDADRAHIARHDPARILAECEARRRIVEFHAASTNHDFRRAFDWALRSLALPYADHPAFKEEWKV